MKTSDFDYVLPEALIASQPPPQRGNTRLLVVQRLKGTIADRHYADFVDYLSAGDVVVLNDTKVLPARLQLTKKSNGAAREIILLEQHGKQDDWHRHKVLYRRKLALGDILTASNGTELVVEEVLDEGIAIVACQQNLLDLAEQIGSVPLPPYIRRPSTAADTERYQTVWAEAIGSVAAPTASLNMTESMLEAIKQKGAFVRYATLHVGLGTFLPIRTDDLQAHVMHKEYFEIPKETILALQLAKQQGNQILAVGTTITRTLEYAADQILSGPPKDLAGEADIFMYPGYKFKVIDSLLTNFHAPRSTVLMLAAAFAGWDELKSAYEHAVAEAYDFLSYGDSMLITNQNVR